ncbi:MAG: hypothetical protein ACYDBJ_26115 [Aggregatilineales bacterium]
MNKHPTYEYILIEELKDKDFRTLWEAGETRRRLVSTLTGESASSENSLKSNLPGERYLYVDRNGDHDQTA